MDIDYAQSYPDFEDNHPWFAQRRQLITSLLSSWKGPSGVVVEVGCGRGRIQDSLAHDFHFVGIDPSVDLLKAGHNSGAGWAVAGSGENLPLQNESASAMLLLDVLEHLAEDQVLVDEVARTLTPEGIVISTVPAYPILWSYQDTINHHYRRYTRDSLRALFNSPYWQEEFATAWNCILFPAAATRKLIRRITESKKHEFGPLSTPIATICNTCLALENKLILNGVPLPIGTSLITIHKKK